MVENPGLEVVVHLPAEGDLADSVLLLAAHGLFGNAEQVGEGAAVIGDAAGGVQREVDAIEDPARIVH